MVSFTNEVGELKVYKGEARIVREQRETVTVVSMLARNADQAMEMLKDHLAEEHPAIDWSQVQVRIQPELVLILLPSPTLEA